VLNPDSGVFAGIKSGAIIVDMGTSPPSLTRELAAKGKEKGVAVVDAPVSGGDIGARNATLSIMIGGDEKPVKDLQPLFEKLGKTIRHMGPSGAGQDTKMVNQLAICCGMVSMCEAILYAYKAGLNLDATLQAVGSGAAASWSWNNYGPRMLTNDYKPGFMVEHFVKDLEIALSEAGRMGLKLPGLELALSLYKELKSSGYGRQGTHSLIFALAKLNGVEFAPKPQ